MQLLCELSCLFPQHLAEVVRVDIRGVVRSERVAQLLFEILHVVEVAHEPERFLQGDGLVAEQAEVVVREAAGVHPFEVRPEFEQVPREAVVL